MVWLACLPTEDKKYRSSERANLHRNSTQAKKNNVPMDASLLEDGFLMPKQRMDKPAFAVDTVSIIETNERVAGNDRRVRYAQFHDPRHLPFKVK
ncbi:MAG: hypothetical protein U1E78_09450 [Gammaproteobacteria bacterium]